jgi:hypothetical protein
MKNRLTIILIMAITAIYTSCYYDKEEYLYPSQGTCDTIGIISYSSRVLPIIQGYCISCHSSSMASGGIVMGTYSNDKSLAINGKLMGSITHASGFVPMPQGGKLSNCNIALIKKWIDEGTPNN